jgi:hypothetical protein
MEFVWGGYSCSMTNTMTTVDETLLSRFFSLLNSEAVKSTQLFERLYLYCRISRLPTNFAFCLLQGIYTGTEQPKNGQCHCSLHRKIIQWSKELALTVGALDGLM